EGGAEEGGGCGEDADTYGEAIEAIYEVEGVGTGDEPKHGEGDGEPGGGDGMTGQGVDLDIRMTGQGGGEDLAEDLHPGLKAKDIIEETGGESDENGRQESPNAGKRGGNGAGAPERRVEKDQECDRVAQQNGDAAGAGNGAGVDLAEVGYIHPAEARAQSAARRGEGQRKQKRGSCKQSKRVHGISLRVGEVKLELRESWKQSLPNVRGSDWSGSDWAARIGVKAGPGTGAG